MKEGGAVMSRGSATTFGGRGPVSASARGPSRGFGVSLSADAGSVSFGSRSLADSKSKAPISFTIPTIKPSPLVDINHGKVKSGIFNIDRPVRSSLITPHEPKFQFGLNIKNGTEKKSKTARTESLKPRGLFDITRPVSKSTITPLERKVQTALKSSRFLNEKRPISIFGQRLQENSKPKSKELKFTSPITLNIDNGRRAQTREARVRALEPSKILFDIGMRSSLKPEIQSNTSLKPETNKKQAIVNVDVIIHAITESKKKAEKKTRTVSKEKIRKTPKRVELKHRIKVLPNLDIDQAKLVRADIHKTKKLIPLLVRAKGITLEEAQKEAVQILSNKHKNKIVITPVEPVAVPSVAPEMQPLLKGDVGKKVEAGVLARNDTSTGVEAASNISQASGGGVKKPEQANSTQPKPQKREDPPHEKEFFFEKQTEVNKRRIERAIQALNSLLKTHKTDMIPTGDGISRLISDTDTELQSEVAKPVHKDGSLKKFKEAIGKLTKIHTIEFAVQVEKIVHTYPAIKLAVEKPIEGADRRKVEYIYEGPINGKQAFFKDYQRVNGNFQGQSEKTYFIPTDNLPGAPVV